ncbi:MAG: ABC transporter ATP-binding protein [Pseudomonadota bacterium]
MTISQLFGYFAKILGPEKSFYYLAAFYGIAISLLSLATPISVQMLINTIANTGLALPLFVLSATLFGLLLISGLLNALRIHLMEIFGRRFYARMVSEIALRSIYAQNPFFTDDGKAALFNRYFDIIVVQKTIPYLAIGGFTLVLQAVVGFVLTSMYHPLFLAFNIVVIVLLWLTWVVWGRSAIRAAMDLSHKKHEAAAWLEGLGSSNGFFKSKRHIAHALTHTDTATGKYIEQHRFHFRQYFAQTVSLLVIYALASASLLGLGGWLVIQGQLSLGQLVAAELVLSAVFFGISQLGPYLTYFYDLCAAIEELSLFYDVEQEEPSGDHLPDRCDSSLSFNNVHGDARGRDAVLNFDIPSGANVMAASANHGLQRFLANVLKRHDEPRGGYATFGGADILDTNVHALRQEIIVIDRPTIIETTVREYLRLNSDEHAPQETLRALEATGLEPVISQLPDGLDTKIAHTGWPLSIAEVMQLKLTAAILAKPRVLILNQLFDLMHEDCLTRALQYIEREEEITMIYFSNRRKDLRVFKKYLYLDYEQQTVLDHFNDFYQMAYGGAPTQSLSPTPDQRAVSAPPSVAVLGKG